jgi:peptide/nickel transport system permease protein
VFSALRKYSFGDRSLTVFSLVGLAIPNFFMALIVLALIVQWYRHFGWFLLPTGGMTSTNYSSMTNIQQFFDVLWHMAAPLLIIVLTGLAGLSRVMRGQMLDVMSQDYIRTAQAKGLSDRTVTYKHAVRNAVLPIVATIGAGVTTALLGGGTVEFVMGWPGLTPLFIGSVYAKDVYVLMAILTIGTMLVMLGNLISDVLLALIDPRIRY